MECDRVQVLAMLAAMLLGACSSHGSNPNGATQTPADASATLGVDGATPEGGGGALPCNLDTTAAAAAVYKLDPALGLANGAYPGDRQCIAQQDPALGMQFHYGPTNYDDPKEVAKFVLKPGEEVTDCVFFPTPNADTVYFKEYHSRMRPGSHHMLLYLQPNMVASGGPSACNQGAQTRNLFGAQTPNLDTSAIADTSPENDGLAIMVAPKQQVAMQAHFINAGTAPILREVWANITFVDKAQVKILGDPLFFISGNTMNIPIGTTTVVTGSATVPANADPNFRVILATGHYHAHTTRFTAYKTVAGQREKLFEEYGKLDVAPEPSNWYFTSTAQNAKNDPTTKTPGAYSGTVYLKPGDKIDWECEVTNNDVSSTSPPPFNAPSIRFNNAVYSAEMCNMFGLYAPSLKPSTGCPWFGGDVNLINPNNTCP